jgi:hypothetical protein
MYAELVSKSPLLPLPVIGTVIFIVIFMWVLLTLLLRKPKDFDSVAELPLADDTSPKQKEPKNG